MADFVEVVVDRVDELMKEIGELATKKVMVGYTAGSTRSGSPLTNAVLAYVHEHGSPVHNIPARPFLFPAVNGIRDEAVRMLQKAAEFQLDKKPGDAENTLMALGQVGVDAVKAKLVSGPFAPLAPATLAARRRAGISSTKPLLATMQMLQATTYVIRKVK